MSNDLWNSQFNNIVLWLEKRGYRLTTDSKIDDEVDFDNNTVNIRSQPSIETRFYILLHECGHILIKRNWNKFAQDNPTSSKAWTHINDLRVICSKVNRVSTIIEEIDAWRKGRNVAKRMKLYVNDAKFHKLMTDCILSYIEWAGDPKKYLNNDDEYCSV